MVPLLPRVVLQPLWDVPGAEQRAGRPGRRLDGHRVAAREEERESRHLGSPRPQALSPATKHLTFTKL